MKFPVYSGTTGRWIATLDAPDVPAAIEKARRYTYVLPHTRIVIQNEEGDQVAWLRYPPVKYEERPSLWQRIRRMFA